MSLTRVSKILEHKRGNDFSCMVIYDPYSDHISYKNIDMPKDVSNEVKEAFLAEAELAMINLVDGEFNDEDELTRGWSGE